MRNKTIFFMVAACFAAGVIYFFPNKSSAATKLENSPAALAQSTKANDTTSSLVALPQWHGKSIRDLALMVATNNGEKVPTSIKFVKTTRQKANQFVSKSSVDHDAESYLVIMHGNFTALNAFGPAGSKPTGHTIAFVVDASNGTVTDFQMNNLNYDLNQLGLPQNLQ